ncbi:hypothetical protein, partial [Duncaniella muris]|uniref:hypothetical protein n=1 Tax=Duncaniella muris TaxID=2094150 RepID=UPI00197AF4FC
SEGCAGITRKRQNQPTKCSWSQLLLFLSENSLLLTIVFKQALILFLTFFSIFTGRMLAGVT